MRLRLCQFHWYTLSSGPLLAASSEDLSAVKLYKEKVTLEIVPLHHHCEQCITNCSSSCSSLPSALGVWVIGSAPPCPSSIEKSWGYTFTGGKSKDCWDREIPLYTSHICSSWAGLLTAKLVISTKKQLVARNADKLIFSTRTSLQCQQCKLEPPFLKLGQPIVVFVHFNAMVCVYSIGTRTICGRFFWHNRRALLESIMPA